MAIIYVTLRAMPESIEVDVEGLARQATALIQEWLEEERPVQVSIKPVAFGLNAIELLFSMQESRGTTDELEEKIGGIEGIQGCEAVDVRRAIG